MNKKIKNASTTSYNNIEFKSKLEVACYKKLEASGLSFKYEPDKITLWEGKILDNVLVYEPSKEKDLKLRTVGSKLRDITYTPDFKVIYKQFIIYFDVKGHVNDVYPIKKKMLLQHLNEISKTNKYFFFEPHNVRQMVEAINIIKTL